MGEFVQMEEKGDFALGCHGKLLCLLSCILSFWHLDHDEVVLGSGFPVLKLLLKWFKLMINEVSLKVHMEI